MLKSKFYEHKYDGGIHGEFVTFIRSKKSLLINKNEKAVLKPIYLKGEKKM